MIRKIVALIFLMLFVSVSFADAESELFTENVDGMVSSLQTMQEEMDKEGACEVSGGFMLPLLIPSVLVGFALILISTLIYMVGNAFNSPQMIAMAKEEYYQTGISVFLAFIVIASIVGINFASSFIELDMFGYVPGDILDSARDISFVVANQIARDLSIMTIFNGILSVFATSTLSIGSFHSQISFSPGLALKPLTDVIQLMVQVLAVSLSEWIFHIFSLCLIKKWGVTVFLPLGMLLRAIPHTRDGGSAIIALMLVLYIIYPMTFIGMGAVYFAMHPDNADLEGVAIGFVGEFGLGIGLASVVFAFIAQSVLVPLIIFAAVDTVWIFVNEALFMFFVMSLMLPFFSILITLTAAREISKNFFGVDVNLSAIIRVI